MTVCKDCLIAGITTERVAPNPGPRCATHWRYEKMRRSARAYELRLESLYGISEEEYWKLHAAQGGHCAICQISTGKARRLAVDHDHGICSDHLPDHGCPRCIRGLLCKKCNQLIAWFNVESLSRAIGYICNPSPEARKILTDPSWRADTADE